MSCVMFSKKLIASMIMLAEEEEEELELEPVVTHGPRQEGLSGQHYTAIAIFCAAVIFLVVHVCSQFAFEEAHLWQVLACSAAYFVLCVVPLCRVLMLLRTLRLP